MVEEVLAKARKLRHRFLFPSEEEEREFLAAQDARIHDYGDTVFFLKPDADDSTELFFATESAESLSEALFRLKRSAGASGRITLTLTEDETTKGAIEAVRAPLSAAGMEEREENIGYRAKRLPSYSSPPSSAIGEFAGSETEKVYALAVFLLDRAKFAMSLEGFRRFVAAEENVCLVWRDEDVKGFVLGHLYNDGESLFIRGLGVDGPYQGQGVGAALMRAVFTWAKERGAKDSMLWVERENIRARRLYERFGYVPYGDREATFIWRP